MGKFGNGLGRGIGVALLALTALCPISRSDEAEAAGRGAWLGVTTRRLSDDWRERNGYWSVGVMVVQVAPGSSADQAGIGPGDVLVSIDDRSLRDPGDLTEAERGMEPGRAVGVVIARDGGRMIKIFNVEPDRLGGAAGEGTESRADEVVPAPAAIGQEPGAAALEPVAKPQPKPAKAERGATTELGVRCETLNPDLAAALGAPEGRGVLVLEVKGGSPAERAGIRPGDVISQVGDQTVEDVGRPERDLAAARTPVSIKTLRRGTAQEVVAELEGHPAPERPGEPGGSVELGGEGWRDRLLIELRDDVRSLRAEVQKLREELANRESVGRQP